MSRPPSVMQVVPSLGSGGVERGTVDVATALARGGWRSIVVSAGGPLVRELERAGVEHRVLPLASKNPLTMRRNIDRLAELIRDLPVDLVHARSRAPAWSAWYACQREQRPFVTTFHAPYSAGNWLKRKYNSVMARGQRVIAISEFVGRYARETYGVEEARLRVIPRGVDLARFDPSAVPPRRMVAVASEWRLTDGLPVIMLPARLTRWKGHMVLLEALSLLKRRDVQVLLVGPEDRRPAYRRELVERIYKLGLDGIVHVVADCRDMPAALMLADVVVAPSIEPEGFGRTAIEAQAMGRPIIASDHGGAQESILHGETGLLVPPSDPLALAEAIEAMLTLEAGERQALADRARAWVAQRFDQRVMCEATILVYEELLFPEDFEEKTPDSDGCLTPETEATSGALRS